MTGNNRLLIILTLLIGPVLNAHAYINPDFTPEDLINQSDIILVLSFKGVDEEGQANAEVKEVLKGEFPEKNLDIDLYAGM